MKRRDYIGWLLAFPAMLAVCWFLWWQVARAVAETTIYHAPYRAGSVAVALIDASKAVTFSQPLPSTNYAVVLSPSGAAALSYTAKTVNGFTITLSAGILGYVDWMAVPQQ